jgi:RNA polymerase sigma factor (TIGR02999 family)
MGETQITRMLNLDQSQLTPEQQEEMASVYQQLKSIARTQRFKVQNNRIHTTALVNEAWLKSKGGDKTFNNRDHFFGYCALCMRHILYDQARRNKLVTYVDDKDLKDQPVYQQSLLMLDVEIKLQLLKEHYPRLEQIFTYRYFGDMDFDAIARLLNLSERTVLRDWKKSKAMLAAALDA